jgi:anti-sigma factor RsiW
MSHLGQRISALIDDELDGAERDRVLTHLARCETCRGEVLALRTLKRRMNALGSAMADGSLTSKLMGLGQQEIGFGRPSSGPGTPDRTSAFPPADWPRFATAPAGSAPLPQSRPGWYAGAGALVLLASLGTAVFMAGGGQAQPAPKVTPSVDTYYVQHEMTTGPVPARTGPAAAARPAASSPPARAPLRMLHASGGAGRSLAP